MKIAFYTNFINHHQVHIADELYNCPNIEYTFVATMPMPDSFKKTGYPDYSKRPYLLNAYESEGKKKEALDLAFDADVVIAGDAPEYYFTKRIKAGKLTFRNNERWFRSRPWFLSGPRAWINFYKNHIRFRNKPVYMLAASAYTANDVYNIGAYKNKVFKWGYFTRVNFTINRVYSKSNYKSDQVVSIMWCARFLKLKHPELAVRLALRLQEEGYKIRLNMYGSGEELGNIRNLINELKVENIVTLCGNLPNDLILRKMQEHDIFLFTSDKAEGWGAVLNEAMSCGCAVVSSNRIGATPFLIKDGENGLVFESEDLESLYTQVKKLLDNPGFRVQIAMNAMFTMQKVWSPQNAAKHLLLLIEALRNNDESLIPKFGPCSRCYPQ